MRLPGPVPLLVAGLLAALAGGCSKPAPPSLPETSTPALALPTKIRFKTDWYPQAEHGGFYQAMAKGYYKDANLDVDILQGGPGVTVPQLMLSGQCDVAMGRSDDIIVWSQQNLPFMIVAVYMEHDPQALMLHEEDSAKTFADLDHRTIMLNVGVHWMDYLEQKYHITLQAIPMNYGIAQFLSDKTFIQQCFVTNEPYYVLKSGGHPRTLMLAEAGYNPYRVIFTTKNFARDHPEAVRKFIAASLKGWDEFMNGDPSPAKAIIARRNEHMTDDFMNFSIKAMREQHITAGRPEIGERFGLMTRPRMQEQVDILTKLKVMPAPVPLDNFVRFDLLPPDLQASAQ